MIKKLMFATLCATSLIACKINKKTANESEATEVSEIMEGKNSPQLKHEVNDMMHCESVVYDNKNDVLYLSVMGNRVPGDGKIVKLSLDGKVLDSAFIVGLNDPKGIALTDDKLYVSDVTELIEADLETGAILKKYTAENTKFLNDVEVDDNGIVYVSDTAQSSIYTLNKEGLFLEWHVGDELEHPNGLLIVDDQLYISAWGNKIGERQSGNVLRMNLATKEITKISKDTLGNLDGAQKYDQDNILISSWMSGKIMKISNSGLTEDVLQVEKSVGDILYIPEKKLLLLPMNVQNKLLIYEFQ